MNSTNVIYSLPFGAAKWSPSTTHLVSIQYLILHILVDQSQVILQFKNRKWTFCWLTHQRVHLCAKIQRNTLLDLDGCDLSIS